MHRAPQHRVTKDPIPGADYELLVNGTPTVVGLTSLPTSKTSQFTFGQIVPFFFVISMNTTTPPMKNTTVTIAANWSTTTNSGGSFGYDPTFGVLAAFVDAGDLATVGASKASASVTWQVVNQQIQSTFTVTGISSGSTVVVDVWLVLDTSLNGAAGNVPAKLVSATAQDGTSINTGTQTITLNGVEGITTPTLSPLTSPASATVPIGHSPAHHSTTLSQSLDVLTDAGNDLVDPIVKPVV